MDRETKFPFSPEAIQRLAKVGIHDGVNVSKIVLKDLERVIDQYPPDAIQPINFDRDGMRLLLVEARKAQPEASESVLE